MDYMEQALVLAEGALGWCSPNPAVGAVLVRNGQVVGIAYVQEGDELLLISQQGMILRMQTNDVRAIGRATQGVKLIDLEGDDKVVSIAKLAEREGEENNGQTLS